MTTSQAQQTTYRIGEAASLLNLKTYVLRFWEMEFPQIAPLRTEKGQRLYREEDVAVLRRIRYLLHERGLTIEGARRILAEETRQWEQRNNRESRDALPPAGEGPDQETAADEGLDSLDQVLRAELAPAVPGPAAPEGAALPPALARELVAELEDIRRLLDGENT